MQCRSCKVSFCSDNILFLPQFITNCNAPLKFPYCSIQILDTNLSCMELTLLMLPSSHNSSRLSDARKYLTFEVLLTLCRGKTSITWMVLIYSDVWSDIFFPVLCFCNLFFHVSDLLFSSEVCIWFIWTVLKLCYSFYTGNYSYDGVDYDWWKNWICRDGILILNILRT